ncbi:hypothetical protein Bca52824_010104 [Brassica carinata]|uniref:Uncharacterized protein n=1 Tax=Brassica carinata TaxID=52824 RepID=A0A8X7WC25_BRACI|nr:hypothetical protein Bca52824_010103 [Brassica carinata]KAG2327376.1 hypothetical protein Bca52824_010104 [Brassica carinata]
MAAAAVTDKEAMVDPFLVEALQNPRHRLTILRMELDIQKFFQNPDQLQFEFPPFPTSYSPAAHRVAQHYGLPRAVFTSAYPEFRLSSRRTVDRRGSRSLKARPTKRGSGGGGGGQVCSRVFREALRRGKRSMIKLGRGSLIVLAVLTLKTLRHYEPEVLKGVTLV